MSRGEPGSGAGGASWRGSEAADGGGSPPRGAAAGNSYLRFSPPRSAVSALDIMAEAVQAREPVPLLHTLEGGGERGYGGGGVGSVGGARGLGDDTNRSQHSASKKPRI